MSRSQYPYPPDEFDAAGKDAPVGVHRVPRTLWSQVWPFLAVAAVAIVIAVAGVMFLGRDTGTPETTPPPEATEPPFIDPTDAPADGTGNGPVTGDGGGEFEPIPTEAPPHDPVLDFVAQAQLNAHIRILNDSGIQGEAARGVEALQGRGFTNVEAGNNTGTSPATTVVWYRQGFRPTAMAVAASLGLPGESVSQVDIRTGDVAVIVRSALTPAPHL